MVITGPNGQKVMLMSDACGENPNTLVNEDWTFEDAAQTFVPNGGPCAAGQAVSFKPSNYLGSAPEPDDLSPGGGPAPPTSMPSRSSPAPRRTAPGISI